MIYREVVIDGKLMNTLYMQGDLDEKRVEYSSPEYIEDSYIFRVPWHRFGVIVVEKDSTMRVTYSAVESKKKPKKKPKKKKESIIRYCAEEAFSRNDMIVYSSSKGFEGTVYKVRVTKLKEMG